MHKYSYFMRASYLTGACAKGGGNVLWAVQSQECISQGINLLYDNLPDVVKEQVASFTRVEHGGDGIGKILTSLQCCLWKSEKEWHLAFKGTQFEQLSSLNYVSEVWTNAKLFFGADVDTNIVNECLKIAELVKKELEKHNSKITNLGDRATLTVSGHSLGGTISLQVARKHGLQGYHFDPGCNLKVHVETSMEPTPKQMVYRTLLDPASILYLVKEESDVTVTTVYNNLRQASVKTSPLLDSHSTDHFWCEVVNCTSIDKQDSLWVTKEPRKKSYDRHKIKNYTFLLGLFLKVTDGRNSSTKDGLVKQVVNNIENILQAEEESELQFLRQIRKTCYAFK